MKKQPKHPGPVITDPDLVDRIFEYLLDQFPQMRTTPDADLQKTKLALRDEFGSDKAYIRSGTQTRRAETTRQILALFNGRNATEIARKLQISRATVYRKIKQEGR